MSEHRVQLVRKGFDAWNQGDPSWVLKNMSPQVEWITPPTDPYAGTYRGHEGVEEFWTRWRTAVGELHFDLDELIDAGEHVVAIARRSAQNPTTGLQVSDAIAQVFTFDGEDVCVRVEEFHGREAALRAAGLDA
jgi:ketosteroid isomerase-like protein